MLFLPNTACPLRSLRQAQGKKLRARSEQCHPPPAVISSSGAGDVALPVSAGGKSLTDALAGPEKQIIQSALIDNGWNRKATAESLGINRTTLYKKMKKYSLGETG